MKKYDEIHIDNLQVFANHGVFEAENKLGQKFMVSACLYTDTVKAALSDDLSASTDYGRVCHFITYLMKKCTCKLIETVAENIARAVLMEFPLVEGVDIEIKKPWAPVELPLDNISVKISRWWHDAYIALGSNMGDRRGYLDGAVKKLDEMSGCRVCRVSSFIETEPYGGVEQDDFLNGCLHIKTIYSPEELLERLHKTEAEADRKRDIRWGPRTLDLDIILYDDLIYESEDLVIPHIEMHKRDFVLRPLAEIAPRVKDPVSGKTAAMLLEDLEKQGTEK